MSILCTFLLRDGHSRRLWFGSRVIMKLFFEPMEKRDPFWFGQISLLGFVSQCGWKYLMTDKRDETDSGFPSYNRSRGAFISTSAIIGNFRRVKTGQILIGTISKHVILLRRKNNNLVPGGNCLIDSVQTRLRWCQHCDWGCNRREIGVPSVHNMVSPKDNCCIGDGIKSPLRV
jgi:hypothetical protein